MLDSSAIIEIAKLDDAGVGRVVTTHDGLQRVYAPPGWIERIADPIDTPLPSHIQQRVRLDDVESFIAYVNTWKTQTSRIFVSVAKTTMTALLDYHTPTVGGGAGMPDYVGHIATYQMPFSEEWTRWARIDGQPFAQVKFAEFLEENLADVVEPSGATLLEVALQLQAKKKVQFESGVRLQDGTSQLTYREEIESAGRNNVKIPAEFSIGIPVFFGGDAYKMKAFLRYRIDDGKLTFTVVLHRRKFVLDDAVKSAAAAVAKKTGIVPFFGTAGND